MTKKRFQPEPPLSKKGLFFLKYDFISQIFALDSICKLTIIENLQINLRFAITNFQIQKPPIQ